MNILMILLLTLGAVDREVISQTACISTNGKSVEEAKAELLLAARSGAVEKLFGSLVTSLSQVDNPVLQEDQIKAASMGYVRLVGDPVFFNGDNLGEVCVKIQGYAAEEDRARLRPRELSRKSCVAEGDVGTIRKRAEEKAVYEALTDYEASLKRLPVSQVSSLLHDVQFSEGGFIQDTLTYCVRAAGFLYPIEVAAMAFKNSEPNREAVPVQDPSGRWIGEWKDLDGWAFSLVMDLRLSGDTLVTGTIEWTLKLSPEINMQKHIGHSAVEIVRGSFSSESSLVMIEGYEEHDPHGIIGLDGYKLILSRDGQELQGETEAHGTWAGRFSAQKSAK
jgi:hypothetical protein